MLSSSSLWIGMALLGISAAAAFAVYRWRQRNRVHRVKGWVTDYLHSRYGQAPAALKINCSEDPLWPILAAFDTPRTGSRHTMQFICPGLHSTLAILSEKDESQVVERGQGLEAEPALSVSR